MTPKQKAAELFDRYNSFDFNTIVNSTQRQRAKECALIAVEHLIELSDWYDYSSGNKIKRSPKKYWQDVKNEINNF